MVSWAERRDFISILYRFFECTFETRLLLLYTLQCVCGNQIDGVSIYISRNELYNTLWRHLLLLSGIKLHTDLSSINEQNRSCGESGRIARKFPPCNKGESGLFEAPLPLVARNASKSNTLVPRQPYKNSPRGGCWLGWPINKAATLTLLPPQYQLSERSGQTAGNRRLAGCSKDHVMAVEGRITK